MSSHRHDPHAVLGVARTATAAQIGHAYRELLNRHQHATRPAPIHLLIAVLEALSWTAPASTR